MISRQLGLCEYGEVPSPLKQTLGRWGALESRARQRLLVHLLRLAAIIVVLYAALALAEHSWWRPALNMAIITTAVAVTRGVRDRLRTRERRIR